MTTTESAYSFLPWLRRGIATQISQAPGTTTRASVTVKLQVTGTAVAGGGTPAQDVEHVVQLYGPGDIIGVDPRAVVRTEPRDQITNFEPNHLPFIEFYDEDFPWRYSPAIPDPATGRLAPWLALIVLTDGEFNDQGTPAGQPLPSIALNVGADFLPRPAELAGWAHVHVNGTVTPSSEVVSEDMAAVLTQLGTLLDGNPDLASSRLMCPRQLEPEVTYHAFLVPAFESGRLAGLGLDPAGTPNALQPSWGDYPNRPNSTGLCYYYRWQFQTSAVGDFEYLVRLLKPGAADGQIGYRDMDVQEPGMGLPTVTTEPSLGGLLWLGGALRAPDADLNALQAIRKQLQDNWDQPYPQPFQQALAALINLGDAYQTQGVPSTADPDPLVTPPLYGRWPALTTRLLTASDGTPLTPDDNWIHQLNLDPRYRVPAGTGGRVVRQHDEEYMQAAWDQLGDVLAANQRIRAAQFVREIGFSLHANQLTPLRKAAAGRFLAVSAPLQPRIRLSSTHATPALTITATLADGVAAATPLSPAMRRLSRPGSRLMRDLPFTASAHVAAARRPPGPNDLLERMNDGQVTAAAEKSAPTGVVTVDALEQAIRFTPPAHFAGQPHLVIDPGVLLNPVSELPTSANFVISMPGDGVRPTAGGPDSPEAVSFKQALNEVYTAFNSASLAGETVSRSSVDLEASAQAAMDGMHPDLTVPRRALSAITVPSRLVRPTPTTPTTSAGPVGPPGGDGPIVAHLATPAAAAAGAIAAADTLSEIMAYPVIDVPMFRPLADISADLFCPNVNLVAPNSVTVLSTNWAFIESYLVGLNHEMARELLWREYPTDQRGSVFRQFWNVQSVLPAPGQTADQQREQRYDIPPIHLWNVAAQIGANNQRSVAGTATENLVLVIRGELLKKYPTTVIYAQKAARSGDADGSLVPVELTGNDEANPPPALVRTPIFDAKLEPDVYFFGFDLSLDEARGGTGPDDLGWFFIIKERPGDPRFGLNVERDTNLGLWNDLAWPDVLPAGAGAGLAGPDGEHATYIPLNATTPTPSLPTVPPVDADQAAQYGEDHQLAWDGQISSADVAYILFRAPVLVAIHVSKLVNAKEPASGA